jgi:hypothetical protein
LSALRIKIIDCCENGHKKNEVVLIDRHTIKLIELNVNQRNTHLYQW